MRNDLVAQIKARIDLAEDVIIPDIGEPQHQGQRLRWLCPFHAEKTPSLYLNPDGQSYHCFGCNAKGDAFTWLMQRHAWDFRQALQSLADLAGLTLDGQPHPTRPTRPPRPATPATAIKPPAPAWQARGRAFLERAQALLWEEAGAVGLAYLHARGLRDDTLRTWGLGWCPQKVFEAPQHWGLAGKSICFPRGVVIPHLLDGELWALKVRRFTDDHPVRKDEDPWGKYGGPRGGQATLYGLDRLHYAGRPLFLVEAELDALLLWQEARDLVDVLALATASREIATRWLVHLLPYERIFAALDADGAGVTNTTRLADLSQRIAPARIPAGNDPTEYAQRGGDIRAWVQRVITGQQQSRYPLVMVIPAVKAQEPGLALPYGRCKRLADGALEVVFNSARELQTCLDATRAIRG